MKKILIAPLAIGTMLGLAGPLLAQSTHEEAREQTIPLSEVPQPAMDAAKQALGTNPTDAKLMTGTSPRQYVVEAKNAAGEGPAVQVTGSGNIVNRETGGEERGGR